MYKIIFASLLLISTHAFSQACKFYSNKKNTLYGLQDSTGKKLTPLIYKYIGMDLKNPRQDIFEVAIDVPLETMPTVKERKIGFINNTGKEIVPPIYNSVLKFSTSGYCLVLKKDKWLVINEKAEVVYAPDSLYELLNVSVPTSIQKQFEYKEHLVLKGTQFVIATFHSKRPLAYEWRLYDIVNKNYKVITQLEYDSFLYGEEKAKQKSASADAVTKSLVESMLKGEPLIKTGYETSAASNGEIYLLSMVIENYSGHSASSYGGNSSMEKSVYCFSACVSAAPGADAKSLANKVWGADKVHFPNEIQRYYKIISCSSQSDCEFKALDFDSFNKVVTIYSGASFNPAKTQFGKHTHEKGLINLK
jgi:hypothetical protein